MRPGMLVEVNCESDFVARTDDFQQLDAGRARRDREGRRRATDAWLKDPDGPVQQRVAAAHRQARREHGGRRASSATRARATSASTSTWAARSACRWSSPASRPAIAGARRVHDAGQGDRDADRGGEPGSTSRAKRFRRRRSRRNARSTARRWRTRASRRTSSTRSSRASSAATIRSSSCPTSRRSAIRR